MNISFECNDKVNAHIAITLNSEDYKAETEKLLIERRKRISMPGFRPGQVPLSLVRRQYGVAIKADVVNKIVGEKLFSYLKEHNIEIMGEPLPSENHVPVDMEKEEEMTFSFDMAVKPEINLSLSKDDKLTFYNIKCEEETINEHIKMLCRQNGEHSKVEKFTPDSNDMIKGKLTELDATNATKEGGIVVEDALLMPSRIKDVEQRNLLEAAIVGKTLSFCPQKAYSDSEVELASLLHIDKEQTKEVSSCFLLEVKEILHYQEAEVNQDLFDKIYGKGTVSNEKEFRDKVEQDIRARFALESEYKFRKDMRDYIEKKVGDVKFAEDILKRMMKSNAKNKENDSVEENFSESIRYLKWHIIKEKVMKDNAIKVENNDLIEQAQQTIREQFAQYGMSSMPENYVNRYAEEMIKDEKQADIIFERTLEKKVSDTVKNLIAVEEKIISIEEFRKLAV